MSDEHILRIPNKDGFSFWKARIYMTNADCSDHIEEEMYGYQLEPATPKEFIPICRYLKLCDEGVRKGWEPCLMKCPYREMKE